MAWRAGLQEKEATAGGRLHRRDTPHHLKNKRVSHMDANRAKDIIAQVLFLCLVFAVACSPCFMFSFDSRAYSSRAKNDLSVVVFKAVLCCCLQSLSQFSYHFMNERVSCS